MRKILVLAVSAFVLSLAACDSSSSSPTGGNNSTGGSNALVGTWMYDTSGSDSGYMYTDTEFVTLSSNWNFVRRTKTTTSVPGYGSFATAETLTGTWTSTSTHLILTDTAGTDSATYTLSGSQLTVVLATGSTTKTLKFTKQ
jgi:hypothetical protein